MTSQFSGTYPGRDPQSRQRAAQRTRLRASLPGRVLAWEFVGGLKMGDPASTPIAYTRGLTAAGTWDADTGVYKDTGGYIAFLGGNVAFYSSVADKLDVQRLRGGRQRPSAGRCSFNAASPAQLVWDARQPSGALLGKLPTASRQPADLARVLGAAWILSDGGTRLPPTRCLARRPLDAGGETSALGSVTVRSNLLHQGPISRFHPLARAGQHARLSADAFRHPAADTTYIIGHKNPDADAICSAIAYAAFPRTARRTRLPRGALRQLQRPHRHHPPAFPPTAARLPQRWLTARVRDLMVADVVSVSGANATAPSALEFDRPP